MLRQGWTFAAIALVSLAACKKKLDSDKFEGTIRDQLSKMGVPGAKVECPDNVEAKKGTTFTCQIQVEGKSYDWPVTMDEVKGDQVSLSVPIMFPRKRLVDVVSSEVTKKVPAAVIDCGTDPVLFPKDNKIYCDVSAGSEKGKLRIDTNGVDVKGWEIETAPGAGSAAPPAGSGSGSGS